MHNNSFLNRLVLYITDLSTFRLIFYITAGVLLLSVLFVYLFTKFFDKEYSSFLFILSVILPLILNPLVVVLIMKLAKHLHYYKTYLEKEIRKNKEKDLLLYEQARFAVMGEMMANISHQWKQPLNTINLVIVSSRFSNEKSCEEIEKAFDTIENNVEYLAKTVDDFLSYFDKRTYQELRFLEEITTEISSISYGQLKLNKIKLNFEKQNELENLLIASSITQVLLNLINNAKDALVMQKKEHREIVVSFYLQDDHLMVKCCDSGDGVLPEIQEKIFEPYFTIKPKNRGTGLGLYMSKQIIFNLFKGRLYVDEKKPSCFVILIPFGKNCKLEKR